MPVRFFTRLNATFFVLFLICFTAFGQSPAFTAKALRLREKAPSLAGETKDAAILVLEKHFPLLSASFVDFDVYRLPLSDLRDHMSQGKGSLRLDLARERSWDLEFEPNPILSPSLRRKYELAAPQGDSPLIFKGTLSRPDGGIVRLTLTNTFIQGFATENGKKIFIESLNRLIPGIDPEIVIVYPEGAVLENPLSCAAVEWEAQVPDPDAPPFPVANACYGVQEVEIATAATYQRYLTFGSVNAVNSDIVSILNMVEPNYEAFNFRFVIAEQIVFTTAGPVSWTDDDVEQIFTDFTDWAPTGFTEPHDIGILFFDGPGSGVVGKAWVGSVCSGGYKYNVCDLLSSADKNRVLVAHEMGHNFGSYHDVSGSGFIMNPSVDASATAFSAQSIAAITDVLAFTSCVSCELGNPPVAANQNLLVEAFSGSGTEVITIDASDPEGSNLSFAIVGGDPGNVFDIGTATGIITVNDPDALTPGAIFILTVRITDQENQATDIAVSIEVPVVSAAPVEWLNFSVKQAPNGHIVLTWQTASELHNDFFQVEKSIDRGPFETIGKVSGAGTSQELQHYRHEDPYPTGNELRYRLKQVDFDGKYQYSQIVLISQASQNNPLVCFPNPFKGTLSLRLPTGEGQHILEIYNSAGQKVLQGVYSDQPLIQLDLAGFPQGMYLLKVHDSRGQQMATRIRKS